jgi:nicotinic acid mononucleotide adenylyltransferase
MEIVNIIVLSRDNIMRCDKINKIKKLFEENIDLFNESISGKIHFSRKHKSIVSSTIIRERISRNKSIMNYVSKENNKYIFNKGLYK